MLFVFLMPSFAISGAIQGHAKEMCARSGIYLKNHSLADILLSIQTDRRGCFVTVQEPWQGTEGNIRILQRLSQMQEVLFFHDQFQDKWLIPLKNMRNLEGVFLGGQNVTDEGLAHIGHHNLVALSLRGTEISDKGLESISKMTNLKYLSLSWTTVTDNGLKTLEGLKNLEILFLDGTRTTRRGYRHLQNMTKLRRLRLATLTAWPQNILPNKVELSFAKMQELEELDARGSELENSEVKSLASLKKLTTVRIGSSRITDDALASIEESWPIEELEVEGLITNRAIKHLSVLKKLNRLALSSSTIDDGCIPDLMAMKSLRFLFIGETRISVKGVHQLRGAGIKVN